MFSKSDTNGYYRKTAGRNISIDGISDRIARKYFTEKNKHIYEEKHNAVIDL